MRNGDRLFLDVSSKIKVQPPKGLVSRNSFKSFQDIKEATKSDLKRQQVHRGNSCSEKELLHYEHTDRQIHMRSIWECKWSKYLRQYVVQMRSMKKDHAKWKIGKCIWYLKTKDNRNTIAIKSCWFPPKCTGKMLHSLTFLLQKKLPCSAHSKMCGQVRWQGGGSGHGLHIFISSATAATVPGAEPGKDQPLEWQHQHSPEPGVDFLWS